MKKNNSKLLLAALAFLALSCAKETVTEEPAPEPPKASTVHVTVGAGIAQTKSEVYYADGVRTLKFSDGDRLYVRANVTNSACDDGFNGIYYQYVVAGFLTIDASSINGASASFSGDLSVYQAEYTIEYDEIQAGDNEFGEPIWEIDYQNPTGCTVTYPDSNLVDDISGIFSTDDPLGECSSVNAVLVHKDIHSFTVFYNDRGWNIENLLEADVETLMTTRLKVTGSYDSSTQSFSMGMNSDQAIMNCTINGLTPNAQYLVRYASNESNNFDNPFFLGRVNTDNSGKATFAYLWAAGKENYYHALFFRNDDNQYDMKLVNLGQKTLSNKVYNISRVAVNDPNAPVPPSYSAPTVSRNDGGDEEELIPSSNGAYTITAPEGDEYEEYKDIRITISGSSSGCNFNLVGGYYTYVTLSGNGTAVYEGSGHYMYYYEGELHLILDSDYTIIAPMCETAIDALYLYLGSTGGTHTLTVTTAGSSFYGIFGSINYYNNDISNLAEDGCTVTFDGGVNNGDGTWTFTYTVSQ